LSTIRRIPSGRETWSASQEAVPFKATHKAREEPTC